MSKFRGFTFVELMIVVAIIAIIGAIALPQYQLYVAKAQLGAALADIRPGKTTMENVVQDSRDVTLVDADFLGLYVTVRCPTIMAELADDGSGTISCTVAGNAAVNGKDLLLRRSAVGDWQCDASAFVVNIRPYGCG